jgi:hypothetical protein
MNKLRDIYEVVYMNERLSKIAYQFTSSDKQTINRLVREFSEYTDDITRIVNQQLSKDNTPAPIPTDIPEEEDEDKVANVVDDIKNDVNQVAEVLPESPMPLARLRRKVVNKIREIKENIEDRLDKKADVSILPGGTKRYVYPTAMGDIAKAEDTLAIKGTPEVAMNDNLARYYHNNPGISRDKVQKIYDDKTKGMKYGPTTHLRQDAIMRKVVRDNTGKAPHTLATYQVPIPPQVTTGQLTSAAPAAIEAAATKPVSPAGRLRGLGSKVLGKVLRK